MASRSVALAVSCVVALFLPWSEHARADDQDPSQALHEVLELRFTPTGYAQVAVWIQNDSGTSFSTVALTEAVATRGIGNRPGASQMNSGFRWPYGRREGVLPVWAHRRAAVPGAKLFRRVIFQDRITEGLASRTSDDFSNDNYFCLSFDTSRANEDALDAVSCASVFSSDKGRFITQKDVDHDYAEPYEDVTTLIGRMQPLSLDSLYPPRRDVEPCAPGCYESPDVAVYDAHAREVMPDIDAVTMATPRGGEPQRLLFAVPDGWTAGDYEACIEVNVEGDENAYWTQDRAPTPVTPGNAWDSWALGYGYAYRGQPSVVYCTPFKLGEAGVMMYRSDSAIGSVDSWDTANAEYGALHGMDHMTDDPVGAPGSGGDRLLLDADGDRMKVIVRPPLECKGNAPPSAIDDLEVEPASNKLHAHEWASLSFAAAGDDTGVFRYEVRVSTEPMLDDATFMRGMPAKSASIAADELRVPTNVAEGGALHVDMGGLIAQTHYYIGVRALDVCAHAGPIAVAELTTPKRVFATVTPCFVATAAYGTPLADEISSLRRLRDRQLANNAVGRALVDFYYEVGPKLADAIREHEQLRAITRTLLAPVVAVARALSD